ncbi:H-NS family nucleoid-associated regulatory protein [Burkholderia sp. F1]|uniref:H-NS histone family protein n=1 Tax=Burkholderia sp. F1 TaxID=3366817 RepID=UPI003D71261A
MATYKELLAKKAQIEEQLEVARQAEVGAAIATIQELMAQYGLTPDDIAPRRRRASARRSVEAKYMDPKTGKTWSGRGRAPAWLGKNRERFRIKAE